MSVYHYDNARVARRLMGFILIVTGVVLMIALYYLKTRAQSAKAEVLHLTNQIEKEEIAIQVLRAELAYLENPSRLRALSADHLGLKPTPVEQLTTIEDITSLFPLRAVEGAHP